MTSLSPITRRNTTRRGRDWATRRLAEQEGVGGQGVHGCDYSVEWRRRKLKAVGWLMPRLHAVVERVYADRICAESIRPYIALIAAMSRQSSTRSILSSIAISYLLAVDLEDDHNYSTCCRDNSIVVATENERQRKCRVM